ncbi:MAG: VWA domain-containing protein [Pseudomonadota bacterium]
MIEFAAPWAFLLLPLPILVWFLVPAHRNRIPALRVPFFRRIAEAADVPARKGSVVLARGPLQIITAILVWCLLIVAMARPEHVGAPIEIKKAARDVVLAIDISGSMDDRDFEAEGERLQRLDAVKRVVGQFVEDREGDRVALVVFGTRPFIQAPFTEDLRSIRELLDQTQVGMAGPHTSLGDAIGLAIRTFEASEVDQRLLILLSDGADTGSRMTPINAAEIARQRGVEIHTIGVGAPDATGEDRVDIDALKEIAQRGGGQYFFADDLAGLTAIYERIDALTPRETQSLSYRPREALAHAPLALAAILALLSTAALQLGTVRRRLS